MNQIVYLNGAFLPAENARVSPFDYGFLYGFGLFETMRAYKGHIFRLSQHVQRLCSSAKSLGLIEMPGPRELEKACVDTLKANSLGDARVRLAVSPGEGAPRPDLSTCRTPTIFVSAQAYAPPTPEAFSRGYKAIVSSFHRNSQSPLSRLKITSYMESLLARREAQQAGADEALLFNDKGFIAEGSASNVFMVAGGALVTPSLEDGVLPGITRGIVLELASSLGLDGRERAVSLEELLQADEAFLTNSLIEVIPLAKVGDKAMIKSVPGPVTRRVAAAYRALVEKAQD